MCKKFSSDGETCYFPEDNYGVCYPSCNDIEPKDIYKYVNKDKDNGKNICMPHIFLLHLF